MKVIIDSRCRILYASFYIKGLYYLYGAKHVSFSLKYFKHLHLRESCYSHYFAFVLIENKKVTRKIVIDYWDKSNISDEAYGWCDVYAKINFDKAHTSTEYYAKILSIPPSFGIKLWDKKTTLFYAINNLMKSFFCLPVEIRKFLGCYKILVHRPRIEEYTYIHT
jgi:hypothetical protein